MVTPNVHREIREQYTLTNQCIIIGAGDVVANRLLPALISANFAKKYLVLHNGKNKIPLSDNIDGKIAILEMCFREISELLKRSPCTVVFLATPPEPRPAICEMALKMGHFVVAEKPLAVTSDGIARLKSLGALSKRLFALSYYALEKALPWTVLNIQRAFWDRQVRHPKEALMSQIRKSYAEMGRLQYLQINICEGQEHEPPSGERFWYQDHSHGVWFDMGVHIFMMALIGGIGRDTLGRATCLEIVPNQYELMHRDADIEFEFRFGKHFPQEAVERNLLAQFEKGSVFCDFDSTECLLNSAPDKRILISNDLADQKYQSQVSQVMDFVRSDGWETSFDRRDLFNIQLKALSSLVALTDSGN